VADSFQRLIHTLREARYGTWVVTIHNGEVVKLARMDREVRIEDLLDPNTVPGS
jgi:hypothetical protein